MRHARIDSELFAANRRRLVALLPPKALALVHAADVLPTNGDGTLKVQPASDLFWLSGIEQEESVLVLCPQASDPGAREILFVRQLSEQLATPKGDKLTKEYADGISEIVKVRWPTCRRAFTCLCVKARASGSTATSMGGWPRVRVLRPAAGPKADSEISARTATSGCPRSCAGCRP